MLQHKCGKECNIVNNSYDESVVLLVNVSITLITVTCCGSTRSTGTFTGTYMPTKIWVYISKSFEILPTKIAF